MEQRSQIAFGYYLDHDTDLSLLPPEAVREKTNLRAFVEKGKNIKLLGTSHVFNHNAGILGWCRDVRRRAVIVFFDTNEIYRYYVEDKTVELILSHVDLNLGSYVDADVVGDLLYFTDNVNPPRKINLDRAINYTQGNTVPDIETYTFGALDPLNEAITVVKPPPVKPPSVQYITDSTYGQNNLKGRLFQFRYNYIYDDWEESAWSPISKVPYPTGPANSLGLFGENLSNNNCIQLSYNASSRRVREIQFAYRIGNSGNWTIFKRIKKYTDEGVFKPSFFFTSQVLNFYGDEVIKGLDQLKAEKLFHRVPQLARTQKVVQGNQLVYGNYVEGYDDVDINVSATPVYEKKSFGEYVEYINVPLTSTIYPTVYIAYYNLLVNLPDPLNDVFTEYGLFTLELTVYDDAAGSENTYSFSYSSSPGEHLSDVRDAMADKIDSISYDINIIDFAPFVLIIDYEISGGDYVSSVKIGYFENFPIYKTFRLGTTVKLALQYYDKANRSGFAQIAQEIKIPFYTEQFPSGWLTPDNPAIHKCKLNWQINHTPPSWATHYQWLVSVDEGAFFHGNILEPERSEGSKQLLIRVNDVIAEAKSFLPVNYEYYNFQQGDRIRFISYSNGYQYFSDYLDFEILGSEYPTGDESYEKDESDDESYIVDQNGNKVRKLSKQILKIADFDYESYNIGPNTVIEIYRPPKESDEDVYREIGECYDISGGYHLGPAQDQTATLPATGSLEGNAFVKMRIKNATSGYACASMAYSDFYQSTLYDRGRPGIVLSGKGMQRYETGLIASEKMFEDTEINGLSDFAKETTVLNRNYGEIVSLDEVGYILKVKQLQKDTSIYINRVVVKNDAESGDTLATTKKVFGSVLPSVYNYGCVYPKSIVQNDKFLYYFDLYNGRIIRDAYNGPFPISDYGMRTYFREKREEILNAGVDNCNVVCGYDSMFKELIVSFEVNGQKEAVVFNEDEDKWSHFVTYYPDSFYMNFANTLLVGKSNGLHLLNDGNRNEFFGVQHSASIKYVFNQFREKNKIFETLKVSALGEWVAYSQGDVYVLPYDELPNGMVSLINEFKNLQGNKFARFLRNMITTSGAPTQKDLFNGEVLRGRVLIVKVKNENSNEEDISHAIVNFNISEVS